MNIRADSFTVKFDLIDLDAIKHLISWIHDNTSKADVTELYAGGALRMLEDIIHFHEKGHTQ